MEDPEHIRELTDNAEKQSRRQAYLDYLASPEWRALTDKLRKACSYTCWKCYRTEEQCGKRHDSHHRDYHHFGKNDASEFASLTLLCRECHEEHHRQERLMYERYNQSRRRNK